MTATRFQEIGTELQVRIVSVFVRRRSIGSRTMNDQSSSFTVRDEIPLHFCCPSVIYTLVQVVLAEDAMRKIAASSIHISTRSVCHLFRLNHDQHD